LKEFLCAHPTGRVLFEDAEPVDGDVNWRANLAYRSEVMATDGAVLVGDAAGFIDPFYSPGMDWISFSSLGAARLIMSWRSGEDYLAVSNELNKKFEVSYHRMFESLYKNKYDYMGDFDLMGLAFRLDIALYYMFIVFYLFQKGEEGFSEVPFSSCKAYPIFFLMRLYNKRFAAMGRHRRERGLFGRNNAMRRDLFQGFNFNLQYLAKIIFKSLAAWIVLEVKEGWRTWFPLKNLHLNQIGWLATNQP
jgi:hypothetical protein